MATLLSQLNTEIFVLNLQQPLSVVPEVPGYGVTLVDAQTLEVEVRREQSMNDLFTRLSQQGVAVLSMRNKQNRLEQLFIDLVASSRSEVAQ